MNKSRSSLFLIELTISILFFFVMVAVVCKGYAVYDVVRHAVAESPVLIKVKETGITTIVL